MRKVRTCLGFAVLLACLLAHAAAQTDGAQMATVDRLVGKGWWPTKGSALRDDFVGSSACVPCHKQKVQTQSTTPMANTATLPAKSAPINDRPKITAQLGAYHYEIQQVGKEVQYSATNGKDTAIADLIWAFGSGEHGQTYVYEKSGTFYESRLSFYEGVHGLDLTTGHSSADPKKIDDALGRPMDPDGAKLCFSCHTTASTTHYRFDPSQLMPGVQCEACHGPGARHVAAMNLDPEPGSSKEILNPARLSPVDSVEFCGTCHRSRLDVILTKSIGVPDVRFQAYRLETSKCFATPDARMTCIACHDPHQALVREPASYDKNCLSCHSLKPAAKPQAGGALAAACPVKDKDCVSCHMPKVDAPGMHSTFVDHRIRIVRSGAPFPE